MVPTKKLQNVKYLIPVVAEYDSGGKALTAMCEIALEACGSWFPQDTK